MKKKSNGQILMEVMLMLILSCAFLGMVLHINQKGKKAIESSRFSQ